MDPKREKALQELADTLQYQFKDLGLLHLALCHSSYVHEHAGDMLSSNERLEFLGDAVLELCVTQLLFHRYPHAREGQLSKARSAMVNEGRLAQVARELKLGSYLLLGRGEELQQGRQKPSLLADAMEAVLAAIYLDSGLEAADTLVRRLLGPFAEAAIQRANRKDYKTRIQEKVQEMMRVTPRYQLLEASGPDHAKTFRVALIIDGRQAAVGEGRSKKEAEQMAARRALEEMEHRPEPA